MEHVQQREGNDCGLAVASMVADIPYDELRDEAVPSDGLSLQGLVSILNVVTDRTWRIKRSSKPKALVSSKIPDQRCILLIRWPGHRRGHFVAYENGIVYDPEMEPVNVEDYIRNDWNLIYVIL